MVSGALVDSFRRTRKPTPCQKPDAPGGLASSRAGHALGANRLCNARGVSAGSNGVAYSLSIDLMREDAGRDFTHHTVLYCASQFAHNPLSRPLLLGQRVNV